MSVRSFTVFQDAPPDLPQSCGDGDVRTITLSATDAAATLLSTLAAIEKENLHPVTGQRPGAAMGSEAKKRKTGVLATKVLDVPAPKKHKELKGEPKKARKSHSSAGKSRSSDARKTSKSSRSSRKTSPLPPVAEEPVLQRPLPHLSIPRADIDARCYELTVSPLADVSEAYDATRAGSQGSDVHAEGEQSVEPAIRDYFSPSIIDPPHQATDDTSPHTDDPSHPSNDFSTPERKHIYSAFTFSSRSPTSERFRQARSSPTRCDSPTSALE